MKGSRGKFKITCIRKDDMGAPRNITYYNLKVIVNGMRNYQSQNLKTYFLYKFNIGLKILR